MSVAPRQVRKQLVKRVARDTRAREHLQLIRVADDPVNEMERRSDAGPKPRTQLFLLGCAELGVYIGGRATLALLGGPLSDVAASAARISGCRACDVTDGAKTHRNLNVPA